MLLVGAGFVSTAAAERPARRDLFDRFFVIVQFLMGLYFFDVV